MDRQQRSSRPDSIYQITVQGHLDESWSGWFEGLTISHLEAKGVTVLSGSFADQAALRGAVNKLWDLRLTLISVTKVSRSGE